MAEIEGLIEKFSIQIEEPFTPDQVARLAADLVIRSIPVEGEPLTSVDGDDMIYLPLVLNLPYPQYDLVLTDESQDFNKCQIEALLRMTKGGGRAIVVGDPNQAMYAFRCSEAGAFTKIKDELAKTQRDVAECDLPVNYRCDESIIEHARQWVPGLLGRGEALGQKRGQVTFTYTFGQAVQTANNNRTFDPTAPTYAFLCRTNVPLVVTAYALMAMGKKVTIVGRQVLATPLLNIINDLCGTVDQRTKRFPEWGTKRITDLKDAQTGDVIHQGFMSRLVAYRITQLEKLEEEKFAAQREALEQNCDCLELIAQKVTDDSVDSLKAEINSLFVEDEDVEPGVIVLSTGHRAKGLEWDVVFVVRPDLMPHPLVVKAEANRYAKYLDNGGDPDLYEEGEEIKQERNIQYVTATRAKHDLHYISNWPFGRSKKVTMGGIKAVLGEAQGGKTEPPAQAAYHPSREEIAAEYEARSIEGGERYRPLPAAVVNRLTQVARPQPPKTGRSPANGGVPFVDDGEPF